MTSIVVKCTIATNLFRTTWREIIIFTMLYIIFFQFIIKRNVELQCRQVVWKNVRPGGWVFVNYHRIYLTNSTLWQGHHVSSCQVIWNNIATLLFCRDTDIAASKKRQLAAQIRLRSSTGGCYAKLQPAPRRPKRHASVGRRNSRRELRSTWADESDLLTLPCYRICEYPPASPVR